MIDRLLSSVLEVRKVSQDMPEQSAPVQAPSIAHRAVPSLTIFESGRHASAVKSAQLGFGMSLHIAVLVGSVALTSLDYHRALEQEAMRQETVRPVYLPPAQPQLLSYVRESSSEIALASSGAAAGPPALSGEAAPIAEGAELPEESPLPAPTAEDFVLTEIQVDSAVTTDPSSGGPSYPQALLDLGIEGEVIARYIVDSLGRADVGSYRALQSTHAEFTDAVRDALHIMKFRPARLSGKAVPQLVTQSFSFKIAKPSSAAAPPLPTSKRDTVVPTSVVTPPHSRALNQR